MAYSQNKMTALIVVDPKEASRQILEAFRKAGCNRQQVARFFGVNYQTVANWAKRLDLNVKFKTLEKRAMEEGWFQGHKGGGGYHKNPALRVKRARLTRRLRASSASAAAK